MKLYERDIWMRPITKEDTPYILRWRNKDSVKSHFIYQEELTQEVHIEWLQEKVLTGKVAQFIIIHKENDRPIGSVYLRDLDKVEGQAELGIFIGEDFYRGKGIGSQSIRLITKYGFEILHLKKIYLRVRKTNIKAIKCYEACDFTKSEKVDHEVVFMEKYRE